MCSYGLTWLTQCNFSGNKDLMPEVCLQLLLQLVNPPSGAKGLLILTPNPTIILRHHWKYTSGTAQLAGFTTPWLAVCLQQSHPDLCLPQSPISLLIFKMGARRGNRVSVKTEDTRSKCSAQVIPAGRKSASVLLVCHPLRVTCTWASSQGYPPKGICNKKSEKTNNKLPWKSEGDKIMVCVGKGNEFKAIKERTRGTFRHSREQNAEKD